jgi:hypothetical protein
VSVFSFDGPAEVRIDIQIGGVEVIATERDDVSVTVSPSNPRRSGDRSAAERVKVNLVGGRVVVAGPFRLNLFGSGDSVDVVVEAPVGSRVEVKVKYGSARLAGPLGVIRAEIGYGDLTVDAADRLEIKGGHGDLRVAHVAGDAAVAFKSGTAHVGRVDGALRLTGADGPIVVDAVAGPVEATTSSGTIELGTLASGATVRSAYGTVRVRDAVRGTVRVDGSYGGVEIGVRRGAAVWLDASSQYGVVRTELEADAGPGEGEETLELRLRTGYGDISVHHAGPPAD